MSAETRIIAFPAVIKSQQCETRMPVGMADRYTQKNLPSQTLQQMAVLGA
jgi:hypothetical protein